MKIILFTLTVFKSDLFAVMINPATENTLSLGVLVAGTHSTALTHPRQVLEHLFS